MPITISQDEIEKITQLRLAVDAYREAHRLIHSVHWHKGVPEEHTPPLIELKKALVELGYDEKTVLQDAFADSELLNIHELGYTDKADFRAGASKTEKIALKEKWH